MASDELAEVGLLSFGLSVWLVVLLAMSALGTVGGFVWWYVSEPARVAREHQINVHSHQYQEARKEAQLTYEQQLAEIEVQIAKAKDPVLKQSLEQQRAVIVKRMDREESKLRISKN